MKRLGIMFALCAMGVFAGEFKGVVSDAHCGKAHAQASAKAEQCVATCVKGGHDPVIVSGDNVYKLDTASKDKVKPYYGKAVTVNGSVNGDTMSIDSISGAE